MYIPPQVREKAPDMELKKLDEYIDRVWKLMAAMKPGDVINIAGASKAETRELFLECIKYYMRSHEWQDGLSFSKGFINVQKYDIAFIKGRKSPSPAAAESVKM
jgi:hypothetical protein